MITNAQPWDNLKFDVDGITEVQRKFFGTLYNTYGFFALYANIDGFNFSEPQVPSEKQPEIDRWIISKLNSLIIDVEKAFEAYEPTKAGRLIQDFVTDQLSNWYVRLCRRRFWKGEYSEDKISAYQTLYTCLETVAVLASPIAPFYTDKLFSDLNVVSNKHSEKSVHLADYPIADTTLIDVELEERMNIAQRVSSMVLSIRAKEKIKVRQPLQKIMVPVLDESFESRIKAVGDLILSEVNVKELELLTDTSGVLVKKIKPNFKTIGKKYGKQMKPIIATVNQWGQEEIAAVEKNNGWIGEVDGIEVVLDLNDFEIATDDIPGWLITTEGNLTVALDAVISKELKDEGFAREFVNRIQNLRKESGLEITDRIDLKIKSNALINEAVEKNLDYICSETLADSLVLVEEMQGESLVFEIEKDVDAELALVKK
jgi:isoleucyl-tRNA synthetase